MVAGRSDVMMREDFARESGGTLDGQAGANCRKLLMATERETYLAPQGSLEQYKQVWANMIDTVADCGFDWKPYDAHLGTAFVENLGPRYYDVIYP